MILVSNDDFKIIELIYTNILPMSRKLEFDNDTLNLKKLNYSAILINGKPCVPFGILDTRKRNIVENKRTSPNNNRLDRGEVYVEERFKRCSNIIFSGETAGVFKRYEGVFDSCSKRGKRIIRTYR